MEALVPLALLCTLAILATRWGYDSRDSVRSKEQELASLGLTWGLSTATSRRRGVWFRGRLAAMLTGLATWLDPEVSRRTSDRGVRGLVGGARETCVQLPG
jgi:hypothetical protein